MQPRPDPQAYLHRDHHRGEAGRVDEREFDELYDGSFRRLVAQLYALTGDVQEAQDCVQEAFVARLVAPTHPRPGRASRGLGAHHGTPARGLPLAAYRLRPARPRPRRSAPRPRVAGAVGDIRRRWSPRPQQLPADQRRALVLHHIADLSVADVARETGAPEGTVKARLSGAAPPGGAARGRNPPCLTGRTPWRGSPTSTPTASACAPHAAADLRARGDRRRRRRHVGTAVAVAAVVAVVGIGATALRWRELERYRAVARRRAPTVDPRARHPARPSAPRRNSTIPDRLSSRGGVPETRTRTPTPVEVTGAARRSAGIDALRRARPDDGGRGRRARHRASPGSRTTAAARCCSSRTPPTPWPWCSRPSRRSSACPMYDDGTFTPVEVPLGDESFGFDQRYERQGLRPRPDGPTRSMQVGPRSSIDVGVRRGQLLGRDVRQGARRPDRAGRRSRWSTRWRPDP